MKSSLCSTTSAALFSLSSLSIITVLHLLIYLYIQTHCLGDHCEHRIWDQPSSTIDEMPRIRDRLVHRIGDKMFRFIDQNPSRQVQNASHHRLNVSLTGVDSCRGPISHLIIHLHVLKKIIIIYYRPSNSINEKNQIVQF